MQACRDQAGTITKLEKTERKERAPLLYDLTQLQRDANGRFGFTARRTLARRPAALRGAQGAHLPAHELALHHRRHDRRDQADRQAGRRDARVRRRAAVRARPRRAAAGPRGQRRQGHRPPRDHPHQRRAPPRRQDERRRPPGLRPRGAPLPRRLPSRGGVGEHARGDHGRRRRHVFRTRGKLLLVPGWRGVYGETADLDDAAAENEDEGREQRLPRLEQGRGRSPSPRSATRPRRPSRRAATPSARCWRRWRPPASSWRRRSCARR